MHFPIAEVPSGGSTPTHASDSPMLDPLQLAHSRSGSTTDTTGTPEYRSTPPSPGARTLKRQSWTGMLRDLPKRGWSRIGTPTASTPGTPGDGGEWLSEKDLAVLEAKEKEGAKHKERKRRRKRAEIYVRVFRCAWVHRANVWRLLFVFAFPSDGAVPDLRHARLHSELN